MEQFYEDVEEAMKKLNTHFSIVMGDFNAKIGMKNVGESAVGYLGIGTRNGRGDQVVEFADRNRLRITSTFFHKKICKKWTWKSPNGETKNDFDFNLAGNPDMVKDVIVRNTSKCSDHRMVSCKVEMNLRREREKLRGKKHPNTDALKEKAKEFSLKIQNKFSILGDETEYDLSETNDLLTNIVMEAAMEVG